MRVGVFSVQSRTPRDGPGRGAAGLLVPGFLKGGAGCSFRKPQAASRKGHHAIASQAASRVIVIVSQGSQGAIPVSRVPCMEHGSCWHEWCHVHAIRFEVLGARCMAIAGGWLAIASRALR
jgi:hypothetical protein